MAETPTSEKDRKPQTDANKKWLEAEQRAFKATLDQGLNLGRLNVALQIKEILRVRVYTQDQPGGRQLTYEEQAVWDLASGIASRMGAAAEEPEQEK